MADISGRDFAFCLKVVSHSIRETASPAPARDSSESDVTVLRAVERLLTLCKDEQSVDLETRVYPSLTKLFRRFISPATPMGPNHGLIVLAVLQFYLDFGESLLHDSDSSLKQFFRSCLSKLFFDQTLAKATLTFLHRNRTRLLLAYPGVLPQFFPLILKMSAWGEAELDDSFLELMPILMGPASLLPLFPALLDLPTMVLALEQYNKRSGYPYGGKDARPQNPAPEALLALMDLSYTGSSSHAEAESGDEGDGSAADETSTLFDDLLKDENEGLAERHWLNAGMPAAVQAVVGSEPSERLKHAVTFAPKLLKLYFDLALRDLNDSLLCALLQVVFQRVDAVFPDKIFSLQVRKNCIEFVLASFRQRPHFIAILKKSITDRFSLAHLSTAKAELAMQLAWAVGEYGGGGISNKDAAHPLYESLETLLYENLASSRAARGRRGAERLKLPAALMPGSPAQARLLCFVVTAIAKLASCHRELSPRARVCLAKVAGANQVLDKAVWKRARDYLGLMQEPAICSSILGCTVGYYHPTDVKWSQGSTKAVSSIPFHLLGEKEGPPFHDFRLSDILGTGAGG